MTTNASRSSRVALAWAIAVAAAIPGVAKLAAADGKERGAMSDTWVFYTRSVGSAGTLGGSFTKEAALVRTDSSLPGIPRIGVFRAPMEPGAWDALAGAVRSLGAARSSGRHPPGTAMVSIGIMAKGRAEVVHSQAEGAANPDEMAVLAKAEALVDDTMKHAHQALEGSAEWESPSVAADDDVRVRVRVGNPGLVPVPFPNPASAGSPSALSLVLVRVGHGGEAGESREIEFAPEEISEVGPDGKKLTGPPEDVVPLAPGKAVHFLARSRLRIAPASYRASLRISLAAPPGADEKSVSGTIVVELPALAVVRPKSQGGTR